MTDGQRIRAALEAAASHYAANPAEARSTDSVATATLRNGLVVQVEAPTGERITTDMVTSVGGTGTAPSPGWLLRAAEASCVATLITMRAATLGITLDSLEQLRPKTLQLVRADRRQRSGPCPLQVILQELVGKRAHRQSGDIDASPDYRAFSRYGRRCNELVGATAESL